MAEAKPLADLKDEIMRRMDHGQLAGMVLREVLLAPGKLQAVKRRVLEEWNLGRDKPISAGTLEQPIWRNFRSVAHLWSARLAIIESRPAAEAFP